MNNKFSWIFTGYPLYISSGERSYMRGEDILINFIILFAPSLEEFNTIRNLRRELYESMCVNNSQIGGIR
jgi:hypothetical protein